MNAKQIEDWKRERDIARAIRDPEERKIALVKVYDHRDDMQMECIAHQAERIKIGLQNDAILDGKIETVKRNLADFKKEVEPCLESDKDYRAWKLKLEGGIWLWRILRYAAAAGGGAVILKMLQAS